MDELTRYIFENYGNLMTHDEIRIRHLFLLRKKAKGLNTTTIDNYLSNLDEREFYISVRDRILKEYADSIFLNYCPSCSRLVLTPNSKQCLNCKHKWHVKNER